MILTHVKNLCESRSNTTLKPCCSYVPYTVMPLVGLTTMQCLLLPTTATNFCGYGTTGPVTSSKYSSNRGKFWVVMLISGANKANFPSDRLSWRRWQLGRYSDDYNGRTHHLQEKGQWFCCFKHNTTAATVERPWGRLSLVSPTLMSIIIRVYMFNLGARMQLIIGDGKLICHFGAFSPSSSCASSTVRLCIGLRYVVRKSKWLSWWEPANGGVDSVDGPPTLATLVGTRLVDKELSLFICSHQATC